MELSFIGHALTNAALQVFDETRAKAFSVPVPGASPALFVTAGEREECVRLLMAAWLPTPENVNALPQPLRDYIHELETRCDPAGDVARIAFLHDQARQLEASNRALRNMLALCRRAHLGG